MGESGSVEHLTSDELPWKYHVRAAGHIADLGNNHALMSHYNYPGGPSVAILRRFEGGKPEDLIRFDSNGVDPGKAVIWSQYLRMLAEGKVPYPKYVLMTGFEKFGPYSRNPTQMLANRFHGQLLGDGQVIFASALPAEYGGAAERLIDLVTKTGATSVLSLGYASRVPRIRVETRGVNCRNSQYPDSRGVICRGESILPGGNDYFYTTANNHALVNAVMQAGLEAELSDDPERFICNDLIYSVARQVSELGLGLSFGYMHIPTPDLHADLIEDHPERVLIPTHLLEKAISAALSVVSQQR